MPNDHDGTFDHQVNQEEILGVVEFHQDRLLAHLLVFIAGLALELTGKKSINLVQYLVIGLSLVLFYALVLFALLAGVMYLTRNLNRPEKTDL